MSTTVPDQPETSSQPTARLRAVLVCDLVESTRLLQSLGDTRGAGILRRHDRLARQLMAAHGGREVDKSDGFLVLFERPAAAVAFAVDYQRAVEALGEQEDIALSARVGVHFGEVLIWRNEAEAVGRGAVRTSVEGIAKPIAARLAALALPGQILVSPVVRSLTERHGRGSRPVTASTLVWADHGSYRIRGLGEPIDVHEVASGKAALRGSPRGTGKAHRARSWWGRVHWLVAGPAMLLLVVAAALSLTVLRPPDAIAFSEREWVVLASLVNLTGDPRFDAALDLAVRVSLEQSPYVNVVPHLRVQDALSRMARSGQVDVDRETASEVAIREGARAVVVPTVLQSGGKVRMSLEVVDPLSQGTVHTDVIEAQTPEQVVARIGELTDGLRARLGEAVGSIEQTSGPVDRLTSSNLDALRAFSLGDRLLAQGRVLDAESHFQNAVSLDPEFAMAVIALARVQFTRGLHEEALELAVRANELADRLTSRERLISQAVLATLARDPDMVRRWQALHELYPDYHQAANNLALYYYEDNRYEDSLRLAERAVVPQSVTRPVTLTVRGASQFALGQLDAAQDSFEAARSLGFTSYTVLPAALLAARGDYVRATDLLHSEPVPTPSQTVQRAVLDVAMVADRGEWQRVGSVAVYLREVTAEARGEARWIGLAGQLAASRALGDANQRRQQLRQLIDEAGEALPELRGLARESAAMAMAYGAFMAAREGEIEWAQQSLQAVREVAALSPGQVLPTLVATAEARLAIAQGRGADPLRRLRQALQEGNLLLADVMLAELAAERGDLAEAQERFDTLAGERARAYAEAVLDGMLRIESVVQVNRAHLRAAQVAHARGDGEGARRRLADFRNAWPDLAGAPDLEAAASELEQAISARR